MTSASGACAAVVAACVVALAPAGAHHRGAAAVPLGYPDLPAALPSSASAAGAGLGPGVSNISSAGSLNWAGYAVSRRKVTFRLVRATFFVPYLSCADSPGKTMSSAWAGLDGYVGHPDSVEQIGIAADCSAAGDASYYAWFEMFPYAQRKLTMKIHAGDSVTAQVSYDAAKKEYRLSLTDNSRGEHSSKLRKCPTVKVSGKRVTCPRNSAEVITEAPATGSGQNLVISPLSDYGAISFASISVTDGAGRHGGIVSSRWAATKIIQLAASAGAVLAEPTSVQADTFDTYWLRES
jgi:Peptidase A4 family